MVASIHTKMIVGEHATISPVNQWSAKNELSKVEQDLVNSADIIITTGNSRDAMLEKILQEYHGTRLRLPTAGTDQEVTKINETIGQIDAIRDTVTELDPKNRWYYYDQAGNYQNNIQETYRKLQSRINEYNQQPYLLFGKNMDVFLSDFWLQKNKIGDYPNNYLGEDSKARTKELQKIIKEKNITIAFVTTKTNKNITTFLKNSWVTVYTLSDIWEDTSGWWYIRYIEKLINAYLTAFNSYD
jgi:ABC-type Zn uptake system ZnuABC Zn-binding protein ZnuA